jgi:hypothetical protein
MSTRYNNGSHYENHQRAAELHDGAAHAHRVAAEAHEKQDHQSGHELSRRALEHSHEAHRHTKQAHKQDLNGKGADPLRHEDIALEAYGLWQARGCPAGSPDEDWFLAHQELATRAV